MKKLLLRLLFVIGFNGMFWSASAQQIDSVMQLYSEQSPVEKMHIHFDKSVYNKEETVWYKIYLLSGAELSLISKNVYVEWYDTTGKILKQTVTPLFQSSAKGSFELPSDYTGNFIHVKAYTRWMLNDDPAFLYERDIVINSNTLPVKKPVVIPRTRVDLFPEGGFLVQGVSSRLAFKAVDQFGNPVMIKGVLVNSRNQAIDTLRVQHDGMGLLTIHPQAGETYKVNWTDENGRAGNTPVEAIKPSGAVLNVSTNIEKAIVRVERTADAAANFTQFNLLVHMNQQLFFKVQLKGADKLVQQVAIPIEEIPTGVLQFSLFSSDWIPVAERVVFINNHTHEFNVKINPQQVSLTKRGKNVIDIQVSDTAFANMSVAITDAAVPVHEMNTIFSDILLSGEVKGKIYNPGYYLKSDTDTVTAHLDLVMLTNGWRRFDWDKIKAGVLPALKYPIETDLMVLRGKVLGIKSISTASPLFLNAVITGKDSSKRFVMIPVNKDGSFEDKNVFFYDTSRVYYNFNGANKTTDGAQVQFDNGLLRYTPRTITYGTRDPLTLYTDSLSRVRLNYFLTQQELLKKAMAATTLQEVIVKTTAKKDGNIQEMEKKYTSGMFTGGDGYNFDLTMDPFANSARDVLTYLQGKVAGLNITGTGPTASVSWRGGMPALFMNEMQVNVETLQTINVGDIAYLKVLRPPFFGAMGGGANGAIAIYTRKGGDTRSAGSADSKGMDNTVLGGYSRFKEFYNPSYEKVEESMEADVRTTLYWNPFILTNQKTPRHRIQFYNNDFSKQLRIVLEGVNSEGKMTRVVRVLE
jgi:hypothetical protein